MPKAIFFSLVRKIMLSTSGSHIMASDLARMMETTAQYGRSMSTVSTCKCSELDPSHACLPKAESRFMVSGSADNTLRLWSVQTGKCLYTWEFPTAVKRVAFSPDDSQVVCITEQRMGHQCAIRVFDINREGDGSNRGFSIQLLIDLITSSQSPRCA